MTTTIEILAGHRSDGSPVMEAVPATPADERSCYRLLASPGLAEGAAAGDLLRLRSDGGFEVYERGGNVAVQLFARTFPSESVEDVRARVEELGGCWLDGGGNKVRVFTIPVSAGFPAIEAIFTAYLRAHPAAQWSFANVYEPDGTTPLGWWKS